MKLYKDILARYFTIASPYNSHYEVETNTFDFIDRNSNILLVTIGDSWTWGADLTPNNRLKEVYGNLVSLSLGADWLNLAQSGSNNFFIAERAVELGKIIPQLNYKKIYLICTFTETGRSFNSHHDNYIDYVSWFQKNNITDFLAFLNKECMNRISTVVNQHNIILRTGTNFVDATGFTTDIDPWFRQLNIPCATTAYAGSTGVRRLCAAEQFIHDKESYKNWISNLIDQARHVDQVCASKLLINAHPTATGHKIWANSIIESLK